ncbi:MAG: hypothetical protein WEE64_07990 [Dehalococcoidia bacterium]
MAIRVVAGALVKDRRGGDGELLEIVPITSLRLPSSTRADYVASGKDGMLCTFPAMLAVLDLRGGEPERDVTIVGAFGSSLTEPDLFLPPRTFTWGPTPDHRLIIEIDSGEFVFQRSTDYEFRFLCDGEPVAVLPLAITWDDEATP